MTTRMYLFFLALAAMIGIDIWILHVPIHPAAGAAQQCKDANGLWRLDHCWSPEVLESEQATREFFKAVCEQDGGAFADDDCHLPKAPR